MNTKKDIKYPIGFTAVDNRLFYTQEVLTPNAFSILVRIYRMTNGYDGKPKALSNTFFQKYCNISKNTVTKVVKELEVKGFIITQKRSRSNTLYSINMENINNQYLSTINDSQDLYYVGTNDVIELAQELGSNKQNSLKQNNTKENINIPFDSFWIKYDYKKNKSDCMSKWHSMTDEERTLTMESLDLYIQSTPDKNFRKYPLNYLENECWNDEVIVLGTNTSNKNSNQIQTDSSYLSKENRHTDRLTDSTNNKTTTNQDILAKSSEVHWSELKSKGYLKNKVNPDAVKPCSSLSRSIDEFLARYSSKGKRVT